MAPWPMAWAPMNKNRAGGITLDQLNAKANAVVANVRIYPIEPIYISCFLPSLSISATPNNVKTKLAIPIPTVLKNTASSPKPASENILLA